MKYFILYTNTLYINIIHTNYLSQQNFEQIFLQNYFDIKIICIFAM